MKKEDLIALGLSEEHATVVVNKYGAMIPKERFDEVNNAKKNLESQIKERDNQLKELQEKAKGNEDLTKQIQELQEANKTAKAQYEQQLKEERLASAIKLALAGKVHDTDLVSGLVDKSKIELNEDGTIKGGLDEQVKSLQESKSFLFVQETKPSFKGAKPGGDPKSGAQGGDDDNFGKKVAEFAKTNDGLEKARNSYFE